MDEGTPSPYFTVTPEDHAGWLVITSIIFFIYSVMAVVGKVLLRASFTTIRSPDYILIGSLVRSRSRVENLVLTRKGSPSCSNSIHCVGLQEWAWKAFSYTGPDSI